MSKVIVRLAGGLGNQLFQYAAARRLAYANHVPLFLDWISGFERDRFGRSFSLDHFNVAAKLADRRSCYAGSVGRGLRYVRRRLDQGRPLEEREFVSEHGSSVNSDLLTLKVSRTVYLEGYWQSEAYFKDIEELLRRELAVVSPLSDEVTAMAEQIQSAENAVCLHVRRLYREGDNEENQAIEPDWRYYEEALGHILKETDAPHFFVFSDAPHWIEAEVVPRFLAGAAYTNVDREVCGRDFEMLHLMASCRHFISSFSTFSWWGAWLGGGADKIVCTNIGSHSKWREIVPVGWTSFNR